MAEKPRISWKTAFKLARVGIFQSDTFLTPISKQHFDSSDVDLAFPLYAGYNRSSKTIDIWDLPTFKLQTSIDCKPFFKGDDDGTRSIRLHHSANRSIIGFYTKMGNNLVIDIPSGKVIWQQEFNDGKHETQFIHFHENFFFFAYEAILDPADLTNIQKAPWEYRPGMVEIWSIPSKDHKSPWSLVNTYVQQQEWRFNVGVVPMLTKTLPETGHILVIIHVWDPTASESSGTAVFWPAYLLSPDGHEWLGEIYRIKKRLEQPVFSCSSNEIYSWVRNGEHCDYLVMCSKTGTIKATFAHKSDGSQMAVESLGCPRTAIIGMADSQYNLFFATTTNSEDPQKDNCPTRTLKLPTGSDMYGTFLFVFGDAGNLYVSQSDYSTEWTTNLFHFKY